MLFWSTKSPIEKCHQLDGKRLKVELEFCEKNQHSTESDSASLSPYSSRHSRSDCSMRKQQEKEMSLSYY